MVQKRFKVIIVGGSVAGLTLANLLQNLGIDYIVLEAYNDVAPQLGASIGLYPHGLRILDQVGCYEDISRLASPFSNITARDEDGEMLFSFDIGKLIAERHGYGVLFLSRQQLLRVLFKHIRNKSAVHTNQRVAKIEHTSRGVKVFTQSGSVFEGDIVVGADGVHSKVRSEMWRLGNEASPGRFPEKIWREMSTEYKCVFGISKSPGDVGATNVCFTHKKNRTIAVMAGHENRLFWFLFIRLDKPHYGTDLPRFEKTAALEYVREEARDMITPSLSFGEIFENSETWDATMVSHHVFKDWSWGRVFLLGDSAQKFHILTGQGGESAIESAAVFADNIAIMLRESKGSPNTDHISRAFSKTHAIRYGRIKSLIDATIAIQRLFAWETPVYKLVDKYLIRHFDPHPVVNGLSQQMVGAHRSHLLPVPERPHEIPYDDELAIPSQKRTISKAVAIIGYLGLVCFAGYTLGVVPMADGTMDVIETAIKEGVYKGQAQKMLNFDHVPVLGSNMNTLIAAYFPAIESWDTGYRLLTLNLALSEFVIIAIWLVESLRARNYLTPVRWAILFFTLSKVSAIAIMAPLFFLIENLCTGNPQTWWPSALYSRSTQANTLLPALILGMLVPTLLMFFPFQESNTRQMMAIAWMFSPIYVYVLQSVLGCIANLVSVKGSGGWSKSKKSEGWLFLASLVISICAHFYTVAQSLTSDDPQAALSRIFVPRPDNGISSYQGHHNMFLWDYYILMASGVLWCFITARNMERAKIIKAQWTMLTIAFAVGIITIGPAASISAFCLWRVSKIA
ncbi:hypothetical protein COCMIDRAFT_79568 [Bipolaris oryzae ATCC 44560]|uniref:FAD-binding domain-containing protein n=1 Tax=Bipolaris oryzae ATCC 44560 TaxID=930090 RepID=W7A564_COCMI|nr:uncharacterized protein COCMIDRAFT_79568 [Bipolaris oryzae ATCC 44560]EUC51246.1 hypothetical protein COCMIDRAFT_79568 [Bipolaris oryzae ATCC 44560]